MQDRAKSLERTAREIESTLFNSTSRTRTARGIAEHERLVAGMQALQAREETAVGALPSYQALFTLSQPSLCCNSGSAAGVRTAAGAATLVSGDHEPRRQSRGHPDGNCRVDRRGADRRPPGAILMLTAGAVGLAWRGDPAGAPERFERPHQSCLAARGAGGEGRPRRRAQAIRGARR